MINPELMKLLDSIDTLEMLKDSVKYQMQKFQNTEKNFEDRKWVQEMPQIVKEKFTNYRDDYERLSWILKSGNENIVSEMNKGYYYWRLLRSACTTYKNDLIEYDQQLMQEFNLKETAAISNNVILNKCIGILEQHVIED